MTLPIPVAKIFPFISKHYNFPYKSLILFILPHFLGIVFVHYNECDYIFSSFRPSYLPYKYPLHCAFIYALTTYLFPFVSPLFILSAFFGVMAAPALPVS